MKGYETETLGNPPIHTHVLKSLSLILKSDMNENNISFYLPDFIYAMM